MRLIILLLVTVGCGETGLRQTQVTWDTRLLPIISAFEKDCGVDVRVSSIGFGNTDGPNELGYCMGTSQIVLASWLDEYLWDLVLYHELGHCALGLGHSKGIMSAELDINDSIYDNWDNKVKQLCRSYK